MEPVDYAKIAPPGYRALLLGEWQHTVFAYKAEVVSILRQLRGQGFTHLGMEMLPANLQPMLESPSAVDEVAAFLRSNWAYKDNAAEGYIQMVSTAQQLGMGILALDMPYDQWPEGDAHNERNQHMADVITATVRSGSGRVVAFMHVAHAMHPGGVKMALAARGVRAVMVRLDGGVGELPDKECFQRGQPVECLPVGSDLAIRARGASRDQQRFVVPGPGGTGADYIVHLPQTVQW